MSAESTPTLISLLQQGVACHQQGRLAEAESFYRRALTLAPANFDALHLLGVIRLQAGYPADALALIDAAVVVRPGEAAAYSNRGLALGALGRLDEAVASFDRALALKGDYVDALLNRGGAQLQLGRHADALSSFDAVLALRPGDVRALADRGNALFALHRPEEALASYDRALAIDPAHAGALVNRGNVLLALDRPQAALTCFDRALALLPVDAETHFGQAVAFAALGRQQEAVAACGRAIALDPNSVKAHDLKASTHALLGQFEEAAVAVESALALDPGLSYAAGRLAFWSMQCARWDVWRRCSSNIFEGVRRGERAIVPFSFLAISGSPFEQLQCARIWVADQCPPLAGAAVKRVPRRHERIRLAYMSADFREHPLVYKIADLIERHDLARFETIAVSLSRGADDGASFRMETAFERFVACRSIDDAELAARLRDEEIDILVDLNGHTKDARTRVLAHRAAPIQVNYLGYPGTMGADYVDYILADRFVIPEDRQAAYSEKVVYLPDSFHATDASRQIAASTLSRKDLGLPERGFVFCCFNNDYKITPEHFAVWMCILRHADDSVLWLVRGSATIEANLRGEAASQGVDPDRLRFARRVDYTEYLARFRLADLFLDTLPFNGGATASDALWAGVPVLTCAGESFASRMAGSLLYAIGIPELVTESTDDYVAQAVRLACDTGFYRATKDKLRRNRASYPLFDSDRFRRHLESAYTMMWERYQSGLSPASFSVAPHAVKVAQP